jgi:hypothetical protein
MSLSPRDEKLMLEATQGTTGLLRFLVEKLNWPLPEGVDPEDVRPIQWDWADLRLDQDEIPRLAKFQQIPRLVDNQSYAAFILNFEGGKLPLGAVRRLVNQLVKKKRAQGDVAHQQWELGDLLFFSQGGGDDATLHIVGFSESEGRRVLRTISWNQKSTRNRLELINELNLPSLMWNKEPNSSVSVEPQIRNAFTASYREGIKSASMLVSKMVEVAKHIREEVGELYRLETENGPLKELFIEIKSSLNSALTPNSFADMYAQTMVYGLLTSRITHPEDFNSERMIDSLKFENPFLDALYAKFHDQGEAAFDADEFGLQELAELLARTNVEELLVDFGSESHKDDPVVYFYEQFLDQYDRDQRRELGAYYTPIPIVRFIVSAIDNLIKNEFDLPLGVADATTWGEYAARAGKPVPSEVDVDAPVVRALDPATGTGTFLLEWLKVAHANLSNHSKSLANAEMGGVVNRLDALEISLSAYSVAHLKAGLQLPAEVRAEHRPQIWLADTLAASQDAFIFTDDPISREGKRAEVAKFDHRHSVVFGNPPYLRLAASGNAATGPGGFIRYGQGGPVYLDDYSKPVSDAGLGGHLKNLHNLYAYFWRFAQWKLDVSLESPAIVGFITASSYLNGPAFGGLRSELRKSFDSILIIDLGGDGRGARGGVHDEGVFDGVRLPVAILIGFRKAWSTVSKSANISYVKITGKKSEKLASLSTLSLHDLFTNFSKSEGIASFIPESTGEYSQFPRLEDLMPWQTSGCKVSRTWPISPSRETLEERWSALTSAPKAIRPEMFSESQDRRTTIPAAALLSTVRLAAIDDLDSSVAPEGYERYLYRSFDRQWVIADGRVGDRFAPLLWKVKSPQQIYLICDLTNGFGQGQPAFVSRVVPDMHALSGRGARDVIPLYRDSGSLHNVDPQTVAAISSALFRDSERLNPKQIFEYACGILLGTDYSNRFGEDLSRPGPRIPLTKQAFLFEDMRSLGAELIATQTFEPYSSDGSKEPQGEAFEVLAEPTRLPQTKRDWQFDSTSGALKVCDGEFTGISQDVWEFETNGMNVLDKWLGFRTANGTGRAASGKNPLDKIRPTEWDPTWTVELGEIVESINRTLVLKTKGIAIMDLILAGEMISASDLPEPGDEWKRAPKL